MGIESVKSEHRELMTIEEATNEFEYLKTSGVPNLKLDLTTKQARMSRTLDCGDGVTLRVTEG
jgi:hypothetical protein